MRSLVRPELPTASAGSSQAPTAALDNSAPPETRPQFLNNIESAEEVQLGNPRELKPVIVFTI